MKEEKHVKVKDQDGRSPYRLRETFLSTPELALFRVLQEMAGRHYVICPKVALNDIFYIVRPNENVISSTSSYGEQQSLNRSHCCWDRQRAGRHGHRRRVQGSRAHRGAPGRGGPSAAAHPLCRGGRLPEAACRHAAHSQCADRGEQRLAQRIAATRRPTWQPAAYLGETQRRGLCPDLRADRAPTADASDYYCLHDVDAVPVVANYLCPSQPLRLVNTILTERGQSRREPYYFSGAVPVRKEQVFAANGYSNDYSCEGNPIHLGC